MKKYNLIFLKSNKILLTKKQYSNWLEIQNEYKDYITSLDFENLDNIIDYIKIDYKLTLKKAEYEVYKILEFRSDTIEIEI